MANLQIRGIQDELYQELRKLASAENRSISQQVLFLVKEYLAGRKGTCTSKSPAEVLLELSGSWEDEREASAIVEDLRSARRKTRKTSMEL